VNQVAHRFDKSFKLGFLVKAHSERITVLAGIKFFHTAIWLFFAGCIVAISLAGAWRQIRLAAVGATQQEDLCDAFRHWGIVRARAVVDFLARTTLVEKLDWLAPDLMVQETAIADPGSAASHLFLSLNLI
jgi:hypothetical protein